MESMEDWTMKPSSLPPFPQTLEIAAERRFPHYHRTTTANRYNDNSTLLAPRHFNFAATK